MRTNKSSKSIDGRSQTITGERERFSMQAGIQAGLDSMVISCLTAVIRVDALALKYRGGIDGFERRHPGARRTSRLRGVVAMSGSDLDDVVTELAEHGLILGQDLAIGEMFHGEWEPCEGIQFVRTGKSIFGGWTAVTAVDLPICGIQRLGPPVTTL